MLAKQTHPRNFLIELTKNFGVGIEPTRTSLAGGAPFAFPIGQFEILEHDTN
jgi:hypothetical protein